MIKIEKTEVVGWEHAIRGMRNPKNSWSRMDSYSCHECYQNEMDELGEKCEKCNGEYLMGPNDHKLSMQLSSGGPVHAKYRRMIVVYVDVTAPLYWWKEYDTYKVGTVANSCSTMHKIQDKEFTREDFSCEHLKDEMVGINAIGYTDEPHMSPNVLLDATIDMLNYYRRCFIEDGKEKDDWWQMIQLLPSSYNQKRTLMLNYEVLNNIYISRKHHKLDEWHVFCDWIESLPYSEIITCNKKVDE